MAADNLYVEYRKWTFWWGGFVDSQYEINRLVSAMNADGYLLTHMQHHGFVYPNFSLFHWIAVSTVQLLTFGFVRYYVGPTFVFTRKEFFREVNEHAGKEALQAVGGKGSDSPSRDWKFR